MRSQPDKQRETRFRKFRLWLRRFFMGAAAIGAMLLIVCIGLVLGNRRKNRAIRECRRNLMKIDGAKQQWLLEAGNNPADVPPWNRLVGRRGYLAQMPNCPSRASYTLTSALEPSECTSGLPGHVYRPSIACFDAGTLVTTPKGLVPMGQLKRGEAILARDARDGGMVFRTILQVDQAEWDQDCEINAGGEVIRCRQGVDLLRPSGEWIGANQLKAGDALAGADGSIVTVFSVTISPDPLRRRVMMDFEMEGPSFYCITSMRIPAKRDHLSYPAHPLGK